jgi:thiamine-phosphate pyrophosphorylase
MAVSIGRPAIAMVTDRQRLPAPALERIVELSERAVAAGVTLLQIRERDLSDRDLFALTTRLVAAVGRAAVVVVNDRVDVAIAAGAAGVHLRSDSAPVDRVRRIVPPGFLIGRSVHGVDEARAAADADYLFMGTVFATASKGSDAPTAGVAGLEAVCRAVTVPVVGIGGITADNAADVAQTGAAGIAAIGLFHDNAEDRGHPELKAILRRVRQAFAEARPSL